MNRAKLLWLAGCGTGCLVLGIVLGVVMLGVTPIYPRSQAPQLQITLEADLAEGKELSQEAMRTARIIVEKRVNSLLCSNMRQNCIPGSTTSVVKLQENNRIVVELPDISEPELIIRTIQETGLLEIIDAGSDPISQGTEIQTTLSEEDEFVSGPVYETIITGSDLDQVSNAGLNPNTGEVEINFGLTAEGGEKLGQYTGANVGHFTCIVLDKIVLSCPRIMARIDTYGVLSLGNDSLEEGRTLAILLRYGALPIPLKVISVSEP